MRIQVLLFLALTCFCESFAPLAGVELEERSVLNDRVSIKLPKDFVIMSEEMMRVKYPSERRPTLVFTNESGGINVALNHTQNKATQAMIGDHQQVVHSTFKALYPSAEWYGEGVREINGRKMGMVELVTPAIDTRIYNLIFFTDLDGRLLMGTINCTEKSIAEWKPIAHEVLGSVVVK